MQLHSEPNLPCTGIVWCNYTQSPIDLALEFFTENSSDSPKSPLQNKVAVWTILFKMHFKQKEKEKRDGTPIHHCGFWQKWWKFSSTKTMQICPTTCSSSSGGRASYYTTFFFLNIPPLCIVVNHIYSFNTFSMEMYVQLHPSNNSWLMTCLVHFQSGWISLSWAASALREKGSPESWVCMDERVCTSSWSGTAPPRGCTSSIHPL